MTDLKHELKFISSTDRLKMTTADLLKQEMELYGGINSEGMAEATAVLFNSVGRFEYRFSRYNSIVEKINDDYDPKLKSFPICPSQYLKELEKSNRLDKNIKILEYNDEVLK